MNTSEEDDLLNVMEFGERFLLVPFLVDHFILYFDLFVIENNISRIGDEVMPINYKFSFPNVYHFY